MNKVLSRQLKKLGLSGDKIPDSIDSWKLFLTRVENAYIQSDEDRYLLERSLELSSKEMREEIDRNKKMNLQLAQANKLASLGTMASGIAHELNNPLAAIIGNIEILQMLEDISPKQNERYEKILGLCDRMAGTIRHLLKLSRQSDKSEVFDIRTPIEESLELMKQQFHLDSIKVKLQFRAQEYSVEGNQNTLTGVFQNLFANSRDAFFGKSHCGEINVTIDGTKDGKSLKVVFEDNAGGMPNEVVNKIFDPFYTTKEVGAGTGLGLAISKQVIEEMDGEIQVKTIDGEGTTFTMFFPVKAETEESSIGTSLANVGDLNFGRVISKKVKALVVDDEKDITDYLCLIMKKKFEVRGINSAEDAKSILESETFDLLISDLNMPVLRGPQLVEFARNINPDIKVIFVSGHVDGDDHGELEPCAPYIFLQKPFPRMNDLLQMIINFVETDKKDKAA